MQPYRVARCAVVLLLCLGRPGGAQSVAARAPDGPVMAVMRTHYERVENYLLRAAEQSPDSDYAFRPAASVRTLGEMLAHVAATQFSFCAEALGEPDPAAKDMERTRTTKAAAIESLRASFAYCDRAYALPDSIAAVAHTAPGGGRRVPLSVLVLNIAHDNEHYGNIVTYVRLRGRVPPSSQPTK